MIHKLRLGSLFSGIGGLDYGLEQTGGFETVFQVERDAFCRRSLAARWPHVARFEDVCEVGEHNLAPCNVLAGGFPCQDISTAGLGAGIDDGERSGLWREFARLIGELRPDYAVVENVAALASRGLGRVLGDLADLGYDAEWDCIPAAVLGADSVRERLFVVAYPAGVGRPEVVSGQRIPQRNHGGRMTSDECPKCGGDGIRPTNDGWRCVWCNHAWRAGNTQAGGE